MIKILAQQQLQRGTIFLPPSLYGFLTRLHKGRNFPSKEKNGGKRGEEEENIAKQSDHVLKPRFMRIKFYNFFLVIK